LSIVHFSILLKNFYRIGVLRGFGGIRGNARIIYVNEGFSQVEINNLFPLNPPIYNYLIFSSPLVLVLYVHHRPRAIPQSKKG